METAIPASMIEKFTTFGDFLRFLRRRVGLTQLELSIAVGYSDAQISRLEQNLRLPDIPTIEARFVPALDLQDQPKAVARLLELAGTVRREDAPSLGLCPYIGLNYFDEPDADLYVGRETLVARLLERVLSLASPSQDHKLKFLAIVGASGSGKSSLVRAGLVPALRWNNRSANWPIFVLTPTAQPLESLATSLTQDNHSVASTAILMDDLARDPRSLSIYGKRLLKTTGGDTFLLVIDQFEEIFALCRSEEMRSALINNVLLATSEADGRAIVIITLRADFYTQCGSYPLMREALGSQQVYIGAMSDEELRRAIEEPARRGRWEFEPGLVDLLLHEVGHEPGALPLLSHALLETWKLRRGRMMTLSGYASSGGVRGAIAETAEAVFVDRFNHEQQAIARRIFLRLTELGDETATGETRRRASFTELVLRPEETEATQNVLKALADARLITTTEDSVEVAHEALIREWPKLREWLEDNREGLRLHRHLTEAAREWEIHHRELDGLYRGARLAQAREWAAAHADEMNSLEHEFLDASIAWAEREVEERESQRQRELESAQKLVEAEKQRAFVESQRAEEQTRAARQLRLRAFYLAGALFFALGMVIIALFFGARAREAAIGAQDQQRIASSRELAAAAISNLEVDPERSILLALQAITTTYSIDKSWTAEAEDALHRALQASRVELTLFGHAGFVVNVTFNPNGNNLATASNDGTVKVWDAATGQALLTLTTNDYRGRHGLAFSPDGTRLASTSDAEAVKVWDSATGQELLTLSGHTDVVSSVVFSPDGTRLATGSEDRTARIWDVATGRELLRLSDHTGPVNGLAFSPDGKRLATSSEDADVKVWDARTGQELLTLSGHLGEVYDVVFSPDGTRLATSSGDGTAKIWDSTTGQDILTLRGHTDWVSSVAFSPDGLRLATASFDKNVKIWDAKTGQVLITLGGHTGPITRATFSPDGTRLATSSFDETVKIWNVSLSRELFSHVFPEAQATGFSPNFTRLATGYADGTVKLWQVFTTLESPEPSISETLRLDGHTGAINRIVFNPDGTLLATASEDRTTKVWNVENGKEMITFRGHKAGVDSIAFNLAGSRLATASFDYTINVWDLKRKGDRPMLALSVRPWVAVVAINPDGSRLAAGMSDGSIKLWDVNTGNEILALRGHNDEILSITFSQDGLYLATTSVDGTAIMRDAATGQERFILKGNTGGITDFAFSPDGKSLATAGMDGMAKVWNAVTGLEKITLRGQGDALTGLAFSQDGSLLVTTSLGRTVSAYLLRIEDLQALARQRLTRTLTSAECQQYLHLTEKRCLQEYPPLVLADTSTPVTKPVQSGGARHKVCEVTDASGVNDQFFNQIAYKGVQIAAERFGWDGTFLESSQPTDIEKNLAEFIRLSCDLIVIPGGFSMADQVKAAADANPDQKFQIIEALYDPPPKNVWQQWYAVDQAGFLAGYVAASATRSGKVGTFGGVNFPAVTDFMDGFASGVAYYNETNKAQVEVLGWDVEKHDGLFIGNFVRTDEGRRMAEMLMDEGVDIILPVAGSAGLGAAKAVQERGKAYLIGVDTDWVQTYPEYAEVILTSIEKRLDVSVVSAVQSIFEGTFTGGIHTGTLENGGVGLAPFHYLDELISPNIKADLEQLELDIITGKIKTKP